MKVFTGIRCLFSAYFKNCERSRYVLAEKACNFLYNKYKFSEFGRIFLDDTRFISEYEKVTPGEGYRSLDRKYTLSQLMSLTLDIDGDTAECGVYKGASSYFICKATASTGKKHHLCDSFSGLSAPLAVDGDHWTQGDLSTPESAVAHTLSDFDHYVVHKGWIPDCFSGLQSSRFSFVHIDVDLYQPTRDAFQFFYPRMNTGGLILFDDYGFSTCPGAKRAVDEIIGELPAQRLILLPTGQAFLIKG